MPDLASSIWRDFEMDGVASSGAHKPRKPKIREWATHAEQNLFLGCVTRDKYGGNSAVAVRAAFDQNLPYIAAPDEDPVLDLNPTTEAAAAHAAPTDANRGFFVDKALKWAQACAGKTPDIQIADGMHSIDSVTAIEYNSVMLRGRVTPQLIQITSVEFTPHTIVGVTGALYVCKIGVAAALPARIVPGFPVGVQNLRGDAASVSAIAANGAHKVLEVDPVGRLWLTFIMRSYGPALGTVTAFDTAASLGVAINSLVVPYGALSVSGVAYDGVAIEGFINVFHGATLRTESLGIAYSRDIPATTGADTGDDLIFIRGGRYYGLDTIIVGAPDKCVRLAGQAVAEMFRSCIGGSYSSDSATQLALGCKMVFQRCFIGSFSVDAISLTSDATCVIDQCILASSNLAVRTTYQSSSVEYSGTKSSIAFCTVALQANEGTIGILSANSLIQNCGNWADFSGKAGRIIGDPTRTDITSPNTWIAGKPVAGGGWQQNAATPISPYIAKISPAAINIPSTAVGDSYRQSIDYPGVTTGMTVEYWITNGNPEPDGWVFKACVDTPSGAGKILFIAERNSGAIADPSLIGLSFQARYTSV
jgi:hypothetical protein